MILKILARNELLHVTIEGEFTLDAARLNFQEIIAALEEHLTDKVLIDGRGIVGDPSVVERFYYAEFGAELVRLYREKHMPETNPQFAYVLNEPPLDPLRFGETVAVNRGMNMKAFDNMREAVEWLELSPEQISDLES